VSFRVVSTVHVEDLCSLEEGVESVDGHFPYMLGTTLDLSLQGGESRPYRE
jgi:hypothetical protein